MVGEISRANAKVPLSKVANAQMLGQAAQGNLFTLTSLCMSMYNRHNFSIRATQTRSCGLLEYTFGSLYFKMHTAAAGQDEMHCGLSSCPKPPSHVFKCASSLTENTEQWITVLSLIFFKKHTWLLISIHQFTNVNTLNKRRKGRSSNV